DRSGRRVQGIQGARAAAGVIPTDVQRRAVVRRGRLITPSDQWVGPAKGNSGAPDGSGRDRVALERVEHAVLVDHADERYLLPSDAPGERRGCRPEVGIVVLAPQGPRPQAGEARVGGAKLDQ